MRLRDGHIWNEHGFSWAVLVVLAGLALVSQIYVVSAMWSSGGLQPPPQSRQMPEVDFFNLWSASQLAGRGLISSVYSSDLFQAWKVAHVGRPLATEDWMYPPIMFLLGVPLACLALVPAFVIWELGSLAIAVTLLRWAGLSWAMIAFGLAGPATWQTLILGQSGLLTGALFIAGLSLARRRPLGAGALMGMLAIKPQLGVIAPLAFLAGRFWRGLAAMAAVALGLAVVTGLWFGGQSWWLFFTRATVMARDVLIAKPPLGYINTGVSVFWLCRTLGSGVGFAYAAQGASALVFGGLVYAAWRRPQVDEMARVAFTACAGLMVIPYGYTCDMVAYSIAIAIIVSLNGWRLRPVDVFLWVAPYYSVMMTYLCGVLFMPFFIAAACYVAWRRMVGGPVLAARQVEAQISA